MKKAQNNKSRLEANFWTSQGGTVAILFALAVIPLLLAAGSGVDYVRSIKARTEIQMAADSASLAGAALTDGSVGQRKQAAKDMFAANLPSWLSEYISQTQISVDQQERTVTVSVTSSVPTAFMQLAGISEIEVTNVSVAIRNEGRRLCLLALDRNESNSITFDGSAVFAAPDCAVQSNSRKTNAIRADGTVNVEAQDFCTVGKYNDSDSGLSPTPIGGCAHIDDPYANLEAPAFSGCDQTNATFSNESYVLEPGVFCGGMQLNTHAEVWLEPGIYIIKDGPLTLSAHSSLSGDGVTLYLTGSNTRIDIVSHANIDIKAPTTGPYANIAITQDPTSNPGATNRLEGGGQLKVDGVVHFPTQSIEMAGGGGIGAATHAWSFIASKFRFSGNAQVHVAVDDEEANLPRILENPRLIK